MALTKDPTPAAAYVEALEAGCSLEDAETAYHIASEGIESDADEDYGPKEFFTNDVH